jgi:hypoxanthine phosphoribosyltransferase
MISFSALKESYYLINYHPRYFRNEENPYFDEWSQELLKLKHKEQKVVDFWYRELEVHLNDEFFAIAVVPSSSSENKISGIHLVAQKIAKSRKITTTDATSCLRRPQSVEKLALGGSRELAIHTNSIEVINRYLIKNKNVLLVDDISTTGNSLLACKELLLKAGASKVKSVALGKTVTYKSESDLEASAESAHEEIEAAVGSTRYSIDMAAEYKHEQVEKDAADAHTQIDMDAAYAHEMVEEDAAKTHAQIAMNAQCEHEQVEEDAADAHYSIDMAAGYEHQQVEEDAADVHYSIDMAAEYEHQQVEEDAADAHYSIDMAAEYEHQQVEENAGNAHAQIDMNAECEHEQVEKNAANAHYSIHMDAKYEHEQVEDDAAYAHEQIDVGADYAHLELKF